MSSMKFRRNIAIVIGINDYQDGVPILKTPVNDAQTLAKILQTQHGYKTYLALNQKANRKNLIALLENVLPKEIEASDRLLFYFAGHGIALNGEDGPEGYLLPQDAQLGDVRTYLRMSQMHDALHALPCRHFLGILDCCFAGSFRWSSTRKAVPLDLGVIHKERFDRFVQDPAWQIITSAAHDQTALDAFDLQCRRMQSGTHSPFADALIEALQGGADAYPPAEPGKPSGDGVITATELYLYLRDRVEIATEAQSMRQTPGIHYLKKHDKGEYIFLTPEHELNLPPAPPLDESKNPYRGLRSFDENHRELFFGRSDLIEKLHNFVNTHPLTVVLGASGSGKSSLVKAGLIPKLKQDAHATHENWCILSPIRPGETPFQALNNALVTAQLAVVEVQNSQKTLAHSIAVWAKQNPNSRLLIFIDQSEEIITLCPDQTKRQEFFQQILAAIDAHRECLRVVLSLRSDFEPQIRDTGLKFAPEAFNTLGPAALKDRWQGGRFIVPAMTRTELREAIEKPAEARVMYFQPHDLVEQITEEVADMPGALPLLSFALSELYLNYLKRQQEAQNSGSVIERALTQADYQAVGGVIQSLTQRADQEYDTLVRQDAAYAQTIRNVMLRMVAVGGELARRKVPEAELNYPEPENRRVQTVIQQFLAARLIVVGTDANNQTYFEPAHDALVRGWEKLLNWQKAEEETLLLQRRLTQAAAEWEHLKNQNHQQSGVLSRASVVLNWCDRKLYAIESSVGKIADQMAQLGQRTPAQQAHSSGKPKKFLWNANPYLNVLHEALNSDKNSFNQIEAEFIQRSAQQKRQNKSWRWRIAGVVTLTVTITAVIASVQGVIAQLNLITALQRSSEARFALNRASLDGLLDGLDVADRAQSFLGIALKSEEVAEIRATLAASVYWTRERNRLAGHQSVIQAIAYSPDSHLFATASYDDTVKLWHSDGGLITTLKGHTKSVKSVSFSPDGQTLASGSQDGTVKLWNRQGTLIRTIPAHQKTIYSVRFSPDSQTIVTSSKDTTAKLWNTDGKLLKTLKGHRSRVLSASFSPDGQRIVTTSEDTTVKLWRVDGLLQKNLAGHSDLVVSADFSPDGRMLATASFDRTVKLWNQQGQLLKTLNLEHQVWSVRFSRDGQTIATGGADGQVSLWSADGRQLDTWDAHEGVISGLEFSPDSQMLATVSYDMMTKLWQVKRNWLTVLGGHDGSVNSVQFSPVGASLPSGIGQRVASGGDDTTVKLWSPVGKLLSTLKGHQGNVLGIRFSPNGRMIAAAGADKTVKLWTVEGQLLNTLRGHRAVVRDVSFSPTGRMIASVSEDGTAKLWRLGGTEFRSWQAHQGRALSTYFSPDGQTIATTGDDQMVKLWNLDGKILKTLRGHSSIVREARFSPDGQWLASASDDRTIKLWNPASNTVKTLNGHTAQVLAVSFSPDGRLIASGSSDRTVKLWQSDGTLITTLRGHPTDVNADVNAVGFSPDSKWLATADFSGGILLWNVSDLTLSGLMREGCSQIRNYLKTQPNQSYQFCDR